jgi:hypothetical protein
MELKQCPFPSSRWSPRKKTLEMLADYIESVPTKNTSILEIGGGVSTWYLNQLGFDKYVMVETYPPALENVKKYTPNVLALTLWEDIPKMEYQYIFIDSHVGSKEELPGHRRDAPLEYIMDEGLYSKDSILIAHDYNKIKRYYNDKTSRNGKRWSFWNDAVDRYGWEIEEEIIYRRCFGVYKLKEK